MPYPNIIKTKSLPENWYWRQFGDGSGSLLSPEGNQFFNYDQSRNEYIDPTSNSYKPYMDFDSFKEYVEKWIDANIVNYHANHELQKWLDVWHEEFDSDSVLESVYSHSDNTLHSELNDAVCEFLDSIGSTGEEDTYIYGFDKNGLCESDVVSFYNDAWDQIYDAVREEFSVPDENGYDSRIDWDEVSRVIDSRLVDDLHIKEPDSPSLDSEKIDAQAASKELNKSEINNSKEIIDR